MSLFTFQEMAEVLFLQNYNTRLVVLSTLILGAASGIMGSFLLLRKRSLMGDALSHACLPGIGIAFLLLVAFGSGQKNLAVLLAGAAISGFLGVGLVLAIRRMTPIKDDAAMGIILSVFFGFGVALLSMIQEMPGASAAGLESFIYGKTASMVFQDFLLLSSVGLLVLFLSLLLFKEFSLLCFDESFAASQGWPVLALDLVMLALVAAVTVVGLQAVGLILIIAFLITPAAAARFWSENLKIMIILAAAIGAISGWWGASVSALLPRMPAGAVIVLVAAFIFLISMIFGTTRGVLKRTLNQRSLRKKVGRQHLLRSIFEILEDQQMERPNGTLLSNQEISLEALKNHRSWSLPRVRKLIRSARREDHIEKFDGTVIRLSEPGFGEAARTTRNHRLWELYLIEHADVAPNHVDRDADAVEHVLSAHLVEKLEKRLRETEDAVRLPGSPHPIREREDLT